MKTFLFSFLILAVLQTVSAQNDLASAHGVPPRSGETKTADIAVSEPAIAAFSHTIDDVAIVSLGKGLRRPAQLQVLTPGARVLINKEIPAGQTRLRIDLSGLENGAYTIRLQMADSSIWVKQVVKE